MESNASLFHLLFDVQDKIDNENELKELFSKIVFEWNSIDDIDFTILSEDVLLELLEHSKDFANCITNNIDTFNSIFDKLWKSQRIFQKRLL